VPSHSSTLLQATAALLPAAARLEPFDLRGLPAFDPAAPGGAGSLQEALKRRIRDADAVLMIVPEYLYSLLPVLDNALACAGTAGDNAWAGKRFALIGASPEANDWGRAQQHLRSQLLDREMVPIEQPVLVIGRVHQAFDRSGQLRRPADRRAVTEVLADLVRAVQGARQRAEAQDRHRALMAAARPSPAEVAARRPVAMPPPGPASSVSDAATPASMTEAGVSLWL
jgi:chromate reductase, NAD(P)H dehydrogenase (quinone)